VYFDTRRGNEKLGKQVVVLNRPVGQTCPSNCPLLGKGCYAEKTEKRFELTRGVAKRNLEVSQCDIVSLIDFARKTSKDIRVHERGDFLKDGRLDQSYLKAWQKAIAVSQDLPYIWGYTHVYQKSIAKLQSKKVNVYASVHNEEDVRKAKKKGFKLFAWQIDTPKKKGGSKDHPAKVDLPILGKTLVCPEQRLGRKKITCDKCRWCVEGKGHVVFLKS
jgi:hypothetical protein